MTLFVGEDVDPDSWAELPTHDRVFTGSETVFLPPLSPPVVVTQPNRWGVIEQRFPADPCLVECDPVVVAALPRPGNVAGWMDRRHRPIDLPGRPQRARGLIRRARRLAGMLASLPGVEVAAQPFARTIPLRVRADVTDLIGRMAEEGVVGLRPLEGLGGGLAVSVAPDHRDDDARRLTEILRRLVTVSADPLHRRQ